MNRNGNETESFAGNFVAPDDYGLFFEVPIRRPGASENSQINLSTRSGCPSCWSPSTPRVWLPGTLQNRHYLRPMVYWLDAYLDFRAYLDSEARCVLSNQRALILDLRS
jgi:hypothetical protein